MAQKIQVLLVCDVCTDGKAGTETISFGVDGSNFVIDVCDKHGKALREAVAPYSSAGRRDSGARRSRGRGRSSGGGADRERTQEIRNWAKKKNIKVSERGRLSADLVSQFDAAHK